MTSLLFVACTTSGAVEPPVPPDPIGGQAPPIDGPGAGGTLRVGLPVDPASIDPRFVTDEHGALIVGALFEPLVRLDDQGHVLPGAAWRWETLDDGRTFRFHLREATFHDGTPVDAAAFKRAFDRIADATASPPSYLGFLLDPVVGAERAQRQGGGVSGVVVEDALTLVIELAEPFPGFVTTLANPSLVPLPEAADEDVAEFGARPIGNGPFAMAEPRALGSFVRLVRFDDHRRRPVLDELLFQVYVDDPTGERQWRDLQSGLLHVAQVPARRLAEASEALGESNDGYRGPGVLRGVAAPVYLYGFDVTQPPFDDARVRRAISLAIDRDALARDVMQGTRVAADAIVPPSIRGGRPGACDHCHHDPETARALLAEVAAGLGGQATPTGDASPGASGAAAIEAGVVVDAGAAPDAAAVVDPVDGDAAEAGLVDGAAEDGQPEPEGNGAGEEPGVDGVPGGSDEEPGVDDVPDGTEEAPDVDQAPDDTGRTVIERLTLHHPRGRTHSIIAERMAADIEAALAIPVSLRGYDLQQFVQAVRAGDAPFFRLGWEPTEPDPGAYLYAQFHSSQLPFENLTRFADAEVDQLLDAARASGSSAVSLEHYAAAEQRVLDEAVVVPLLWYRLGIAVAADVRDLAWTPLGRVDFAVVRFRRDTLDDAA